MTSRFVVVHWGAGGRGSSWVAPEGFTDDPMAARVFQPGETAPDGAMVIAFDEHCARNDITFSKARRTVAFECGFVVCR